MTPDQFAENEYRDYVTYRELATIETVPEFKRILEELVQHEQEHYRFWLQFSSVKTHRVGAIEIAWLKFIRKVLGLTFTAKLLEQHEHEAIHDYTAFLANAQDAVKTTLQEIIGHETHHERELIGQIREGRVQFLGSIVLGINDGLIELTGALTGFTFALGQHLHVALLGLVTGVAASLSMAASAYQQARHEEGKDARKAGLYTGLSYFIVVLLLILPFFLIPNVYAALGVMFAVILVLITAFSYYAAVLFERNFRRQFLEMLLFSLGVAAAAFILGSLVRVWFEAHGWRSV